MKIINKKIYKNNTKQTDKIQIICKNTVKRLYNLEFQVRTAKQFRIYYHFTQNNEKLLG